jgi:hypothetical protein
MKKSELKALIEECLNEAKGDRDLSPDSEELWDKFMRMAAFKIGIKGGALNKLEKTAHAALLLKQKAYTEEEND